MTGSTDAMLALVRGRAAIGQCRGAAAAVARQSAVALPHRNPGRVGGIDYPPPVLGDPPHQQDSTLRRQPRILVNVHPADPPIRFVWVPSHSLTGLPRMNNLHSDYS